MKFECHQCGMCCHNSEPIAIWGWEKNRLEFAAHQRNITLDIRPECGFLHDNRLLVFWYYFYMNGRCPFLQKNNWCAIQANKPLTCAIYPYADREFWPEGTWRCSFEKERNEIHHRKNWYITPERYLPTTCAYAAKILRIFNTHERINFCCGSSKSFIRLSKEKLKVTVEMKDLFEELRYYEKIPSVFFDAMQSYSFLDSSRTKIVLDELDRKLDYIQIENRDIDYCFEHWKKTPAKNWSTQTNNNQKCDIKIGDITLQKSALFN